MAYAAQSKPHAQPKPKDEPNAQPVTAPPTRNALARQVHHQYRKAQIETASPTRLIVLLYDGALRFCAMAREAMQSRNLEAQHINLIKAQRIVGELMGSLDRKAGGEVAENLLNLYIFMLDQLVHANLYDRIENVDNVMKMLEELRTTWQEVDRITTQGGAQASGESQSPPSGASVASSPVPAPEAASSGPTKPVPARSAGALRAAQSLAAQSAPSTPTVTRLGDRNA